MKKIIIVFICIFLVMGGGLHAQPPAAIQLANHIAQKMKDTLGLTPTQRVQVYTVNIALHNLKMAVRQNNTNLDSLRIKTQRIEGRRDSLYQNILPPAKYVLYQQKKRNLVTAN